MVQDFSVMAATFFQDIGKARQTLEGSIIVNVLGQSDRLRCEPSWGDGNRTERVAEDFTGQGTVSNAHGHFYGMSRNCGTLYVG